MRDHRGAELSTWRRKKRSNLRSILAFRFAASCSVRSQDRIQPPIQLLQRKRRGPETRCSTRFPLLPPTLHWTRSPNFAAGIRGDRPNSINVELVRAAYGLFDAGPKPRNSGYGYHVPFNYEPRPYLCAAPLAAEIGP